MKSHMKFKIGFFALAFALCLFIFSPRYFLALITAITVHEAGHFAFARICKIQMHELRLGIFGATLTPSGSLFSYGDEILLCLGGPLFNLISVLLCVSVLHFSPSSFFVLSSFALGMLNLLPIEDLDGGRVLRALLLRIMPYGVARAVSKIISFIFIFSLWCISVYLLLRVGASLSLFVFSASLFAKIFV